MFTLQNARKLFSKSSIVCIASFLMSVAVAKAAWDIQNPGYPGGMDITGNMVATNGTLYALGAGSSNPSDNTSVILMQWTLCSGWTIVGGFATEGPGAAAGNALSFGGNNLYIGGHFDAVYPGPSGSLPVVNATNIVAYNLSTGDFSALGDTSNFTNAPVTAIAVDTNQNIYIGTYSENPANMVMEFHDEVWMTVGGGMITNAVYNYLGVTVMAADGPNIYIAGAFDGAENTDTSVVWSTNFIKWDGESWQSMGSEGLIWNPYGTRPDSWSDAGQHINSIAVCGTNVFVAGFFVTEEGDSTVIPPQGIAQFSTNGTWINTNEWLPSFSFDGSGNWGIGYSLAVQNEAVYLGGLFQSVQDYATGDSINCSSVACWTNGNWESLGSGLGSEGEYAPEATAIAADSNSVYVVGGFDTVNGAAITNGPAVRWITGIEPDPCMFECPTVWDWWKGNSNTLDSVGPYNGTIVGTVGYMSPPTDGAFDFNGSDSYIDFGTNAGNFGVNDFTIDLWLETTETSLQSVFAKRPVCNLANMWDMRMQAPGDIVFEICQDTSGTYYENFNSFAKINDGDLHEVTVNRSGQTMTIFVDGVFDNIIYTSGIADIANNSDLLAGADECAINHNATAFFDGLMDNIQLRAFCESNCWTVADWWKGESNALDSTGTNNGTTYNITYTTNSHSGDAFEFNGSSSYIDFGPYAGNFGTNDFMIDFWINTTNTTGLQSVIGKRLVCGACSMWDIRQHQAGDVVFECYNDSSGTDYVNLDSTTNINNGKFHEVTIKRIGLNFYMYIDGNLNVSATAAGIANIDNTAELEAGKDVCIGHDETGYFNGVLDEIRIIEPCQ